MAKKKLGLVFEYYVDVKTNEKEEKNEAKCKFWSAPIKGNIGITSNCCNHAYLILNACLIKMNDVIEK